MTTAVATAAQSDAAPSSPLPSTHSQLRPTPLPPLTSLDERCDSLSTLSSSLSVILQIATTSLYRLSSTQHIQINPEVPPHTHLHATGGTTQAAAAAADGLLPPAQIREDVKEMVEDFRERIKWMKEEIGRLEGEKKEQDHMDSMISLDKELVAVNEEFMEALAEAEVLQKEIDSLLQESCS